MATVGEAVDSGSDGGAIFRSIDGRLDRALARSAFAGRVCCRWTERFTFDRH
jgi:hypothetical protein